MNINLFDFIKSNYPNVALSLENIAIINDIEYHKIEFEKHFMEKTINVIIDQLVLKKNDSVKKYGLFNGLSVILILVAIICVFFSWKTSLIILFISFALKKYAKSVLRKGGKEIENMLHNNFLIGDYNEALTMLFYMFANGQIALQTKNGTSVLPQMPSKCL